MAQLRRFKPAVLDARSPAQENRQDIDRIGQSRASRPTARLKNLQRSFSAGRTEKDRGLSIIGVSSGRQVHSLSPRKKVKPTKGFADPDVTDDEEPELARLETETIDEVMPASGKPPKGKMSRKGLGAFSWLKKSFTKEQGGVTQAMSGRPSTPSSFVSSKLSWRAYDMEHNSVERRVSPTHHYTEHSPLNTEIPVLRRISIERPTVRKRKNYADTSEKQQRLWLLQVNRTIRDAIVQNALKEQIEAQTKAQAKTQARAPSVSPRDKQDQKSEDQSSSESEIFEDPTGDPIDDDEYYQMNPRTPSNYQHRHRPQHRDASSYRSRDYPPPPPPPPGFSPKNRSRKPHTSFTTFDDDQSISSMELLFNWLTCRENSFDDRRSRYHAEGMILEVRSEDSEPSAFQEPSRGLCS